MKNSKIFSLASSALIAAAVSNPSIAESSPLEFYGKFNLGWIDQSSTSGFDPELVSNGSRIGLKGDIDLSENLGFYYTYEWGFDKNFDFDQDLSQRNQLAGLSTQLGNFYAGRRDTEFKMTKGKVDYSNDLFGSSIKQISLGNDRSDNLFGYETAKFGGWSWGFQSVFHDRDYSTEYSTALRYKEGPWSIAYAHNENMSTKAGNSDGDRLSVQYTFGDFQVGGIYQTNDASSNEADLGDAYVLSGAWKFASAQRLWAVAGWSDQPAGLAKYWYDSNGTLVDNSTLYALGYDYKLNSKAKIISYYSSLDATSVMGDHESQDTISIGFEVKFGWGI